MRKAYAKIAAGLRDAIDMRSTAYEPVGQDVPSSGPVDIGGPTKASPPHGSSAAEGARDIIAFLQCAGYLDWKAAKVAQSDTRAWRLAQLAAIFMAADYSSGHLPSGHEMLDRAEELMAEAERRVARQDGVAT